MLASDLDGLEMVEDAWIVVITKIRKFEIPSVLVMLWLGSLVLIDFDEAHLGGDSEVGDGEVEHLLE